MRITFLENSNKPLTSNLHYCLHSLGCNTGIGRVTAHELSKKGARIIMLCRNIEAAKKVAQDISEDTGGEVSI